MADTALSKAHGLALLTKLSKDDAFRGHFEQKPAEALLKLGVPAELICCLPAKCLCPHKLASKAEMEEARKRLEGDVETAFLVLSIPSPNF